VFKGRVPSERADQASAGKNAMAPVEMTPMFLVGSLIDLLVSSGGPWRRSVQKSP
jgi:hypothetical protein